MVFHYLSLERTQFYAREKQDILDLIDHYKQREVARGAQNEPMSFSRKLSPEILETIHTEERGYFRFHVGPLILPKNEEEGKKDVFQELQVLSDFTVAVSYEDSGYFDLFRRSILDSRRMNLYKAEVDNSLFGGLTFIPRDVVDAILAFDLSDLLKEGRKFREVIAGINHPNIRL